MFTRAFRNGITGLALMGVFALASTASANVPVRPTAILRPTTFAPGVFGTAAISVGHTNLDAKWRAVASQMQTPPQWKAQGALLANLGGPERLLAANTWVNHNVRRETDEQIYGVADHWATAAETAANGRGDCEDFAIAKMALLRTAGIPETDLYLTIVRDLVLRAEHAVLLVRLDGVFYVLDSQTDQIMVSTAVSDYHPIITLASGGAWVHGYPRPSAEIQLATAER